MIFNAIAAMDNNKGIGINNKLPWNFKSDLENFKKLTMGNCNNSIIMGRNTWNSIRFLKNRHHYILSKTLKINEVKNNYEIKSFENIDLLIEYLKTKNYDTNWVIGGSQIYKLFFDNNLIDSIYLTFIDNKFCCDAFFPKIPKYFLKKELRTQQQLLDGKYSVYDIIYTKLKKDQELIYKNNHLCTIKDIHFDDYPDIYITIYYNNKEVQTVPENLKFKNYKFI